MTPQAHPDQTKLDELLAWRARGGQIEWRLDHACAQVAELKKDLEECDKNISRLEREIEAAAKATGWKG